MQVLIHRTLAAASVLWMGALAIDARLTGGDHAWWLLGGFTVQTAAQAVLLWLRPARVVDEPLRRRRRPARPTVRQRTPMEKILAEAGPARVDPLESGPRPTRRRDETPRGGPHSAAEPGSIHRVGATPGAKGAPSASAGLGAPDAPGSERSAGGDPAADLCGAPTPHGPCKQRTAPDEPWCSEHGGQSQRKKRGPWG